MVVASPCGAPRANSPVSSCLDRVAVLYYLGFGPLCVYALWPVVSWVFV